MAPLTPSAATSEACDGANHTSTPWSWSLRMYKWGCKSRRGTRGGTNQKKMEVTRLNWALTVAGFLLWTGGGTAAPMECHFNSRELCVFEGRHYSLGETWVDNNCMQCTCLHPVGVGCCEMVHRPVDFPAWCELRVDPVTCKVSLVQTADTRLPCIPGQGINPSHGSLQLQNQLEG